VSALLLCACCGVLTSRNRVPVNPVSFS
jgi:hypothetical protein